ncbi:MAG: hypothetical protein NVS2B14_16650 [Chamaesiphon sp.]
MAKSQWITDFLNYAVTKEIKMVCWFNKDKETDWAVFGGDNGYDSYRYNYQSYKRYSAYDIGMNLSIYNGSDIANPRLLSDDQFKGLALFKNK